MCKYKSCLLINKKVYLIQIIDENVDVIYISSVPITEETLQYYSKLLGLRASIVTGNTTEQIDITTRYKIVIPEALSSFPVTFVFSYNNSNNFI
jgi:hypothetical protein